MGQKQKLLLAIGGVALTLSIILVIFFIYVLNLDSNIQERLKANRFVPPLEFYSAPEKFFQGQSTSKNELLGSLKRVGYKQIEIETNELQEGQYAAIDPIICESKYSVFLEDMEACILFWPKAKNNMIRHPYLLTLSKNGIIHSVLKLPSKESAILVELEPELFAQYYGNKPIIRKITPLSEVPLNCLNAIISIEDNSFLDHQGVSLRAISRAMYSNLFSNGRLQGGSTITQQLVKNYFLTSERTIKRKIKEAIMSILLESRLTKDEIFEIYLNAIYMGQYSKFQIRGYGSAAQFYFNKKIEKLDLSECALLAALINSPGLYNPFRNTERAIKRRELVLKKMLDLNKISKGQYEKANQSPLPKEKITLLSEPAPYFVDFVISELDRLEIDKSQGLKIYTTLDLKAQENAQHILATEIEKIENKYASLKKKKLEGKELQGALISANPINGQIQAIVGGRNYRKSQFNRAIQAQRQVGSVMKPFVYLAALESVNQNGNRRSPLDILSDQKFIAEYEGQTWSPKNFGKKYFGNVPMYFALKSSLNTATAKLGIEIGLSSIVDIARRLGIVSHLQALPAISLGAYELSAKEVLGSYITIARMGEKSSLKTIRQVTDLKDNSIYIPNYEIEIVASPEAVGVLVGMMKQTLYRGTGEGVRKRGFLMPAAGKTGTTSEERDSWFSGFTPFHAAVVWVGYDDNTPHGLTGASGALPIWTSYMKKVASQYPPKDFSWPKGVTKKEIPENQFRSYGIPDSELRENLPLELVFFTGTQP